MGEKLFHLDFSQTRKRRRASSNDPETKFRPNTETATTTDKTITTDTYTTTSITERTVRFDIILPLFEVYQLALILSFNRIKRAQK